MNLSDLDDNDLMRLYVEKDDYRAFSEIYDRYNGKILAYITQRLFQQELANEVFQEVFLKIHKLRNSFDFSMPLSGWIFVIARSVLIDYLRRTKKFQNQVEFDDSLITPVFDKKTELDLSFLKEAERALIESKFFQGEAYAELAERMSQTEASLRKRVSRILGKIRQNFLGEKK